MNSAGADTALNFNSGGGALSWTAYAKDTSESNEVYYRTSKVGNIGFIEAYREANNNGRTCRVYKSVLPFTLTNIKWYMMIPSTTSRNYSIYFRETDTFYNVDPCYGISTGIPLHYMFIYGTIV